MGLTLAKPEEMISIPDEPEKPQDSLREKEKGSRFVTLLGEEISVSDIKTYVQKEIPVLEDYIKKTDQLRSSQKSVEVDRRVAILETDTVMHTTILRSLSTEDEGVSLADSDLNSFKEMTPREWRMLLGILESARGDLTTDLRHGGDINGLKKTILKIENHLDSLPTDAKTIKGWTIPIYDRYGVISYVNPDYSYLQARRDRNKGKSK